MSLLELMLASACFKIRHPRFSSMIAQNSSEQIYLLTHLISDAIQALKVNRKDQHNIIIQSINTKYLLNITGSIMKVSEYMSTTSEIATPDTTLSQIAKQLATNNISCVVIVENRKPVGKRSSMNLTTTLEL